MKKYIIPGISPIILVALYFLTNSWKISIVGSIVLVGYIFWLIGFELGLLNSKESRERLEANHKQMKERHSKETENNPTLR